MCQREFTYYGHSKIQFCVFVCLYCNTNTDKYRHGILNRGEECGAPPLPLTSFLKTDFIAEAIRLVNTD